MGELYCLSDFCRAGSEAERSASRAQGLWVIIGALVREHEGDSA